MTLGTSLNPPNPESSQTAYFALGCFWGAERTFFQLPGVVVTAVGYQGGYTSNPTYHEVCTGQTGHTETVRVVFDPNEISYLDLLVCFISPMIQRRAIDKVAKLARNIAVPFFSCMTIKRAKSKPLWICTPQNFAPLVLTTPPRIFLRRDLSIWPRITTSNICLRTRTVTAVLVARE